LIMIGDAPLPIGMGWAAIIYSAMEFSSRLRMPEAVRPWLDGLLALNIDLAMDAVAIRLLMWTWVIPLDREWFGVPWGNFWAWFIVVSSFSGFLRLLRRWRDHPVGGWLYPALAMALSLLVLAGLDQLFASILYPNGAGFLSTCLIVGAGLAAVLAVRPRVRQAGPPDPVVIAVPLLFHLFFIGAGIYYGFYAAIPALAVISVLMLIGGVAVHLWPWWILKRKAPAD
jgi:hypothetical protein